MIFSFAGESSRSHKVEELFWKRLWTYRLDRLQMNDDDDDLKALPDSKFIICNNALERFVDFWMNLSFSLLRASAITFL